MIDPFFQAAAYQNAYGAADAAAVNAGQEPVYGTLGPRPGTPYYDRDQLAKDPKYQKALDAANLEVPYSDAVGQAQKYKVPLRDWLDKNPADRQAYRDADWQKNPANIFGDAWQWAPWNQPKNPNSLNPDPRTDDHQVPDTAQTIPFNLPAGQGPFSFYVTVTGSIEIYGTPGGQTSASLQNTQPIYGNEYFYGVPESLVIEPGPNTGFYVGVKLRGQTLTRVQARVYEIALGPIQPQGSYTIVTGKQVYISPLPGSPSVPWPITKPIELPEPLPQTNPFAPPQYQPTGYPELPTLPVPYASPQPFPNLRPSPNPTRRPSPYRDPATQPTPFPTPTVDPTAAPTTQPNTEPFPFPSIQIKPNPGPLVTAQPQPNSRGTYVLAPGGTSNNLKIPDFLTSYATTQFFDPGLPPPDSDLCKDPCIKDMHETSESQKPVPIEYQVFVECNGQTGDPVFATESIEVPANQAEFMQAMLNQVALLQGEKCLIKPQDCYAAIPDSHEIRLVGIPPQLVVQYAEQLENGKFGAPKYSISIPYYRYSEADTTAARFPKYTKGQRFGVLVLPDNAKIIVNAVSEAEVNRVLKQLELLILPSKRERVITSNNVRRGQDLKTIKVVPRIAKYFSGNSLVDGGNLIGDSKDAKPVWIKYF